MNLGGFQIGDENSGVGHSVTNFFSDDQSAVIVPDHNHAGARGAHGDITWWYRSVMLEGTEEGGKGCSLAKTPPDTRTCQDIHQERETERALLQQYASELHSDADIEAYQARVAEVDRIGTGGSLVPDECWGTYPTNAYGIVYDAGSAFNPGQWAERVMGWIAEFAFGFGKLVILAALWLTKLSLTFDVTSYADTVDSLANRFDSRLLDIDMSFVSGGDTSMSMGVVAGVDTMSIKLSDIAWFALFAVAGYLALRGKAVRAGGEVLMSIVLFGLAGVLIASATSVGGYFYSAANLVDVSAKGVLLAGYGCDPNLDLGHDETVQLLRGDLDESGCDDRGDQPEGWSGVGGAIHHEFVERPYQWVNWGREELSNDCSVAQSQILSLSGMRSTSYAARHMERAGCVDEANHSREMTTTRLMSTLFAMTVASIVGILLILIAGTLLVAKFIVALLFAMSPFAAAVAVLPGRGRGLAFWWVATLIQAWLAAMVVGFVVAVLLIGMEGIQSTTQDRDLAERWAIMLLLVVVLWMLFKKTRNATQNTAQTVAERLTQATGAGAAWAGAGAGGGSLDFSSVDRAGTAGARMGMRGAMATGRAGMRAASMARRTAGAPIRGAWRTGAQRRRENRQMHKSVLGATIGRELTGDVAPGSWRRLGKRPSARKIQQVGADSRGWVHGRRIHDSHANSRAAATGVVVAPYQGGRPITFQPPTGGGQGGAAGNQGGGNQGGGAGQAGGNQGRGGSWVGAGGNQGGSVPAGGQVGGQRQRGGPAEPRSAKDVKRQLNNDLKEVQAVVKGGRDIQGSALEAAHRLGMTSGDLANYHGSNRDKFAQKEVVTRARDGRSNALAKDRFERASSNDQQRTSSIKRNRRRSDVDRARATVEANQVYVSDPDSPFGRAAQRNIDQANAVLQQEGSEAGEGPR